MITKTRSRTHRRWLGALGLAAVALIAVSPALADRRGDRDRHRGHGSRHEHAYCCDTGHPGRGHARESRFVVPRHIHRHERDDYRAYDRRRVYDPVHRHDHVVYRFPVYTRAGVTYRWHPYCNGVLYTDGIRGFVSFRAPRVSLRIAF